MLKILLVFCSAALACGVRNGPDFRLSEDGDRGQGLMVAIESRPDNPIEEWTLTTFEVVRDSTRLADKVRKDLVEPDHRRYPNPFSPTSTLSFRVSNQDSVRIRMYDSEGTFVARLVDAPLNAGTHVLKILQPEDWDIPAGVYFCVIEIGHEEKLVRKMILLK